MSNVYELMHKYGAFMASQEYSIGDHAKMILETEEGIFATSDGANMADLKPEDIEKLLGLPTLGVVTEQESFLHGADSSGSRKKQKRQKGEKA